MEIFLTVALFALGLLLIIKGGDLFVDAAVWMAEVSGIPQFIIGATIVSLATTLPEMMVSVLGVVQGEVDLAVGNAVGSVTANLGLIMGISIVCIPAVIRKKQFSLKAVLMALGAVVLLILCRGGSLGVVPSALLIAIFAIFVWANLRDAKEGMDLSRKEPHGIKKVTRHELHRQLVGFFVGIVGIVAGSQLLISKGSDIAVMLGVPASIVGVTLVAIGTSLPELVTTITAIVKKESSMSIGNIIGANVIDLTLILPVCSLISGGQLKIAEQTNLLDLPACLLVVLIAILPPLFKGKFYRWQGMVLLLTYAAYVVLLVM